MRPITDGFLGFLGYVFDALFGLIGGVLRWRTMPWVVILFGLLDSRIRHIADTRATTQGVCRLLGVLPNLRPAFGDPEPVLIAASLIPLGATAAVLLLIRNSKATEQGLVNEI